MILGVNEMDADRMGMHYLRPAEVAAELRVSQTTVYELLRTREIPAIRVRGQWRIPSDRFRRWLEDPSRPLPRREAEVLRLPRTSMQ